MADNVDITPGSGTTVASDEVEIAGKKVQVQRIKPAIGADGEAVDVSSANPMPVSDAGGTLSVDDGSGSLTVDSADLGSTSDAESESGDGSVIALLKRLRKLLEGTGKVKVSALEGEPTVKVGGELPTGTKPIGQVDPRGNVAHDGADSGNPVKTGVRARIALPAAVSQDDRTDNISDKFGRQLVSVAPLDECVSATLNRTNTEAGQLLAALAEGAYVVTVIQVDNAHASVGTKVEILDGESLKWKGYAGALGGGFIVENPNGIFVGSKNTALKAKCVTTGADVDISVSAFKIPA